MCEWVIKRRRREEKRDVLRERPTKSIVIKSKTADQKEEEENGEDK